MPAEAPQDPVPAGDTATDAAASDWKGSIDRFDLTTLGKAEPKLSSFPEKFSLRLGAGFVLASSTTFAFGGERVQAQIDWEHTLGGDTTAFSYQLEARYRFTPYHAITLSHYGVDRRGTRHLDRDVEIGDTVYPVGANLSTEIFLNITRLYYSYSFYRAPEVELKFNTGFYFGYVGLSGSAWLDNASESRNVHASGTILVPVPSFGISMRYLLTPRLETFVGVDWFYLEIAGWTGSLMDLVFGLEYRAFDHIGIGAAYNRFAISVDGSFTTSGYDTRAEVENDWNIVLFYLTFYL